VGMPKYQLRHLVVRAGLAVAVASLLGAAVWLVAGGGRCKAPLHSPAGSGPGRYSVASEQPGEMQRDVPALCPNIKPVAVDEARKVAVQSAAPRWRGCRVGTAEVAYAPDGLPEVYFFLVYLPGTPEVAADTIASQVSDLRRQRVELEQQAARATQDEAARLAPQIKAIWQKMRAADRYATVVVGANDGREPFIASFSGLPPQTLLREDAVEARRAQLKGKDPGEPRIVWLPPLFVFLEFPPAEEQGRGALFEARGTQLREVALCDWTRPLLAGGTLQQRREKWQSLRETPNE
jgi:hypothetical protein